MLDQLRTLLRQTRWREFRLRRGDCIVCGQRRVFVKLRTTEWGIKCLRCRANVVAASVVAVVKDLVPDWREKSFYELSARGAVVEFLKKHVSEVAFSEYLDDVESGRFKNGVQCQDVQGLTFDDDIFDVCTSSEVFEHVPDDRKGFREVYRVLRPGGYFIFTVPIHDAETTVERASLEDGSVVNHLPSMYHDDPLRGLGRALCYRDYGTDIVTRLTESGFRRASFVSPAGLNPWEYTRRVVVASK